MLPRDFAAVGQIERRIQRFPAFYDGREFTLQQMCLVQIVSGDIRGQVFIQIIVQIDRISLLYDLLKLIAQQLIRLIDNSPGRIHL